MDGHYLQHSCLYAKHIFDRTESSGGRTHRYDAAVIGLEKMRPHFPVSRLALHDLDQLYRHWERREGDWETLIDSYSAHFASSPLGTKIRNAWGRRS